MEVTAPEVQVDTETLHQQLVALQTSVESLDRAIRGDATNDPGMIGRLRTLEEWKKAREAFESRVMGALVTMAVTGVGTLILAFIRFTGVKP